MRRVRHVTCSHRCSRLRVKRRDREKYDAASKRISPAFCVVCGAKLGRKKVACSPECYIVHRAEKTRADRGVDRENDEIPRDWTGYLDRCVRKEIAMPWERHPIPYDPRDCVRGGLGSTNESARRETRSGQGTTANARLEPGDDVSRRRAPSSHTAAGHSAGQTRTDQFMHETADLLPPDPTGGSASRRPAASSSAVAS